MFNQSSLTSISFTARRKAFLNKIKGGLAIFPSAHSTLRNPDVNHPYRQESSFYYLTGLEEPCSIALFSSTSKYPFQLFVQPKDKTKELWEGKILGPEEAKIKFQADQVYASCPDTIFDDVFVKELLETDTLYYRIGNDPDFDRRILKLMKIALKQLGRSGRSFWTIVDPGEVLAEMRLFKSKGEIERLEMAAQISCEAHVFAMKSSKAGMYEYEIEAQLSHTFRALGAERSGYGSIVASGENACVLHYVANNCKIKDDSLILIDAGAEFDYYTADITRTYPVSGKFTEEQRDIYLAVLKAQKECIRIARPGKTMSDIHSHAIEVLVEELKKLKILKGPSASIIKKKEFLPYYPHGTGHWLGMDVHDVGKYYDKHYAKPRKLEAGMCLTVEPGLYFSPDGPGPAKYKGIGIRIEDDVLVMSNGCKVLTIGAPKEIDEIESLSSQS